MSSRAGKRPALPTSATRTNRRNPRAMTSQHPTIGSLLRSLRARNGWTLKEMSERCGIPLSTLSKVEHDRLTLTYDKLLQISQRLNIRMSELFAKQGEASEPARSEEHTSELQSLMRNSYAVVCLKKNQ